MAKVHEHPLPEHEHPLPQHDHGPTPAFAAPQHEHPHGHDFAPVEHWHDRVVEPHEHDAFALATHSHVDVRADLRGELRGAIRALLAVIEAGPVNTAQRDALHVVRVIIGDSHGRACVHENVAYEGEGESEQLICQDCREVVVPA